MPPLPLSTVPNAGLPAGFRKKAPAGDEKLSAAGIMFVAPDGRALFVRRAPGSDHAGEWAFPAGRVEQDEEPADAARREALEEIGHLASWDLAPLDRATSAEGVDFSTFGQPVRDAFDPVLNEEHNEHVWADPKQPPEPLHPGVAALLRKFFAEEAEEPEHRSGSAAELERVLGDDETKGVECELEDLVAKNSAADQFGAHGVEELESGVPQKGELQPPRRADFGAQDRLAMDRASVRSFDQDGRMRVEITNISKANVCPYKGSEIPGWDEETKVHALGLDPDKTYLMLRAPEELAKSVKSWNGIQLLKVHEPVDVDDHRKEEIVGTTGTNAEFVDPYLRNSLVVWTKEGIELIELDEQREISCGYHYDPDMTPGIFDGQPYDGVMRNIRGNHVALVEEGRVGSDVLVADSVAEMQWDLIEQALLGMAA